MYCVTHSSGEGRGPAQDQIVYSGITLYEDVNPVASS